MTHFNSGGLSIVYEVVGEGPPVVLVHGFASNRAVNWMGTGWFAALADAGYRVIALDCRGHGESDKPHAQAAYRLGRHVEDVLALMDHLGVAKASLMGYSMGARIVFEFLLAHPERVVKAVLGGVGLPHRDPKFTEAVAVALEAPDASAITDPVGLRYRKFAERQRGDLAALAACFRAIHEPLTRSGTPQVAVPVLVVAGEKDDQIIDPEGFAATIPGARLVTVPGRDHMTTVGDPRFKDAVLNFLGR